MKITHDGVDYEFDMDSLQAHELRVVEEHSGMTMPEWIEGLKRGRVDALVAVVFTVQRRAEMPVEWSDLDSLVVVDLLKAFAAANGMDVEAIERGDFDPAALARGEVPMLASAVQRANGRQAPAPVNSSTSSTRQRPTPRRKAAAK